MKGYLRYIFSSAYTKFVVIALIALAATIVPFVARASTNLPHDCDSNAMMWCGADTKTSFDTKYSHGDGHNTAANLQHVYAETGFAKSAFDSSATVDGSVTQSGKVIVNGKTVATAAHSFGRLYIGGSNCGDEHKVGDLWKRSTQCSFRSDSIAAWVYMKDGVFQWAVLKSCGNTVVATPVPPPPPPPVKFSCVSLTADRTQGDVPLTVKFTAVASVTNAQVKSYTFHFGNGGKTYASTSTTITVSRTYNTPGTKTAYVIVNTDHGSTQKVAPCTVTILVTTPPKPKMGCIIVTKEAFDTKNQPITPVPQFTFTLDGTTSASNAGDGHVKFNDLKPGDHQVTEKLPNSTWHQLSVTPDDGKVVVKAGKDCATVIFKNRQVLPVVTPPSPKPPTKSLPNTGPEATGLGLLGSAGLGMGIKGYIRSRKGLLGALLGQK